MSGLVETDVQVGGRRSRQSNVSVGVKGPVATGNAQDVTDLVLLVWIMNKEMLMHTQLRILTGTRPKVLTRVSRSSEESL